MTNYPPDFPRKIVRPRKLRGEDRKVIAVSRDLCVVESMGDEVFGADELSKILRSHESAIVVCQGFGEHLQRLQRVFEKDPQFNARLTPIRRYARPWNDGRRVEQGMIIDTVCNYVGWKAERRDLPNRYHYPLDPIWFLTSGIDDLDDSNRPRIVKLYEWGKQVRDWCAESGLRVKASAGGIAAQLLKDPRFFPEARRKAPRLINDIARYQLPGNYYSLRAQTNHYYRAHYLDMENAHHALAARIEFPNVNSLHAYGHWSKDEIRDEKPRPLSAFAPSDSSILSRPGLFHIGIAVPHIPHSLFPPPYLERPGPVDAFVYSNELQLIKDLGAEITAVYAAYVSDDTDGGLNRYAKWAIDQIRGNRNYKPWLKPTLHASYGLLAARPVPFETGFFHANGGEPTEYHMGNASFRVLATKRDKEIEAAIANVILRGMIEAEVRKEALWFARFLTEVDKQNVLAIYADALFVEDTGPLRMLPPPWKLSKHVSSLRFHSATHFTSPQLSRLPGVPKTARESLLRTRDTVAAINARRTLPEDMRERHRVLESPNGAANGILTKAPDSRQKPRSVRRP